MIRSNLFDYIFVLRPMLFFPGWSTLLAGYLINYKQRIWVDWTTIQGYDYGKLLLILISFAAAMGACFLLNQLKDIKSDLKNNKLFIISEGYLTHRAALIEIVVLIAVSIIVSALLSRYTFYLVTAFIVLTGYLYNFNPFFLKDRPWGSVVSNAAMGGIAFALGWTLIRPAQTTLILDALPYIFLNTALYFNTTLPDMEGDRLSGKTTFAVRYGSQEIIILSFILFLMAFTAAFILNDHQALFVLFLSGPFFIIMLWDRKIESAVRTTKFSILSISLMVCLKIPWYFLLMIGGYFLTRLYFKLRFNFDYPNFRGK